MKRLMTGNEAVARGAYEAGATYASAYPGTPSTEILENMALYGDAITSEWAVNEKVALETAIGASIAGARSLAAMKHVGVNVAADPLFTFAYTGVNGGLVLVSADDPGMHSSQNEQDNRYYAKFAKIPMLEPADSQEAKDMTRAAFELSERFDTPVLLRMTTRVCHSKSPVEEGEPLPPAKKPYVKRLDKFDAVPAVSRRLRVELEARLARLAAESNASSWNRVEAKGSSIGVVSSGVAYQYAREAFGDGASYFKLGMSFPLPLDALRDFASKVDRLYVVEELEPFVEEALAAAGVACVGKALLPSTGELDPATVAERMLGRPPARARAEGGSAVERPPVLCAGCPHRGFFYELSRIKDLMIAGDIGCYGLGGSEPLRAKDSCVCMGASVGMGQGAQATFRRFGEKRRAVAVLGDSTFFHTGMNGLLSAVYNKSDAVVCVLDNRTTGMTGHQDNPGTGYTLRGDETVRVEIEPLVRALGVGNVRTVDPNDLGAVREALAGALASEGPAVVVTRRPCVLKKMSASDLEEFGPRPAPLGVAPEACVGCRLCARTGCPALRFDAAAGKMTIDRGSCAGCGVCAQVCPKKAIGEEAVRA